MIQSPISAEFDVIVIGGGHAGAEAAWAACNLDCRVALVTMDATKVGVMSCNPAIGGLAKGQMVREIDALGGLMGLAADATGIQFRLLNASKGPAVRGPRCQSDKHRYAAEVQRLLATRPNLTLIEGTVDQLQVHNGRITGLKIGNQRSAITDLRASAVVLTTGTFMRGLMHTGPRQTQGGRIGEAAAVGISHTLKNLGFELGRLKTGTPPRLAAESIDFHRLELQPGDEKPVPFSDLTPTDRFPALEQRPCHVTHTDHAIHEMIRANLDRAPMYNGQIETTGPRYCPSIEDKVVRFADKTSHHVFLEPESLHTNEVYCNGISTSLPADVQEFIVHHLPGCERATILRYGYAVEYDMVLPHQIDATTMTKPIAGLFLAGQINGTSGYEEAAGQGLLAGLNAARFASGQELVRLRRDQAYLGVMMDDLVTKTPREPYRMFTSRAEHRLLLRADNTADRLTPLGKEWGLTDATRWRVYEDRQRDLVSLRQQLTQRKLLNWARRPEVDVTALRRELQTTASDAVLFTVLADLQYAGYLDRQQRDIDRIAQHEDTPLPTEVDYESIAALRKEARLTLNRFRPRTMGQASRLAGVTPADVMVLTVALNRF